MAVAQTGAIFKTLEFDGENSGNYGVYISGEAVFNAPERDVEMIAIPNRNGSFALDNGRFENIEVTYPAGIFADNETDFAQAISDFRNFLCSKRGYCRLTDDYNPDEYRMAIYKSGLEVSPAQLKAGEFDITFECKPQRFLTSGETKVTMPGKNKLPYPYYGSSGQTSRGITFTVKEDGTVVLNGTGDASLQPFFQCTNKTQSPYLSAGTDYIMSQTTSTDKSFVIIYFFNASGTALTISCSITYDDGTIVNENRNNITLNYGGINHEWCKFSFTSADPVHIQTDVRLIANAGTVTDATVQPMIRLASETDPHYVRYNGIYNPTLFDARPMLEITGYGEFEINGETLEIVAGPIGMVTVKPSQDVVGPSKTFEFDDNYANQGDDIMPIINYSAKYSASIIVPSTENVVSATVQSVPSTWNANCTRSGTNTVAYNITTPRLVFDYGTSKTNSATVQFSVRVYIPNSSGYATRTVSISCEYAYDGQNTITVSQTLLSPSTYSMGSSGIYIASLQLDSSQSALGSPVYFDLDIGEAYKIENDVPVSVNNSVVMPPELPVLPKGISVITFPNTITDFKIIPRWWKL